MSGRLETKVVLITGGARGQGRSHAVRLAEEGADIIIVDVCGPVGAMTYPMASESDLAETVRLVEALDRRCLSYVADIRDRSAMADLVRDAVATLGRLDVVLANAGVCQLGSALPASAFIDAIQINFGGAMNTIEAALPHLERYASIVVTGSVAGFLNGATDNPVAGPGGAGYSWGKRALASMVHSLALQLAPQEIRVNAVHPTNTNTDLLHNDPTYRLFRPDLESPTREDSHDAFFTMQAMPIPWVEPRDISNAMLWLASDDSRYVTGLQVKVDAGALLRQPF